MQKKEIPRGENCSCNMTTDAEDGQVVYCARSAAVILQLLVAIKHDFRQQGARVCC
jgi:hypothetical protein